MSDLYSFRTREDTTIQESPPEEASATQGYIGRFDPSSAEPEVTLETDADGNVTVRGRRAPEELIYETDSDGSVTVRRTGAAEVAPKPSFTTDAQGNVTAWRTDG